MAEMSCDVTNTCHVGTWTAGRSVPVVDAGPGKDVAKRLTYYNCLNYVQQLQEVDACVKLRPAISICVLDRILFKSASEYHVTRR